ncbi:hypothetical protein GOBAR_AA36769 [Gossypium barbadense]|uniref:Major facilitator superfamily (MFS) profile domain-containing protein n=1 Tax=Gossypium barbadense TaxID=3634 RepID=A0A2P5VYN4_GOSBA|nr:hypothetical protein GOBAR_AA36769 [Gossypium barbadense]
MADSQDIEKGSSGSLYQPFFHKDEKQQNSHDNGNLFMVILCTFVAVMGSFEFGSSIGYSSPTQQGIMEELGMSSEEYSMFGSVLTIGAMAGSISCGRAADVIGRKGVAISTGLLVAYTVGAFVSWRTLALTGMIPCAVMILGLYFIPDSPRWLAMVGCQAEFNAALQKLRGDTADVSREEAAIEHLPKATVLDLFLERNLRLVIIGVGLMVFQQFSGYNGVVFYANQIFTSAGVPPNVGSILYACLQIIVLSLGAVIIDKAGRRPLLMISASGMLLGSLLTGASFGLKEHALVSDMGPMFTIIGIMIYMGSYCLGLGGIPWIVMSEIFPLHIKGIAGSLVTLVSWGGSWVVSFTFSFLMDWNSYGTFLMFAIFCVVAIVFIWKLVPETKGRTLEEIQASME